MAENQWSPHTGKAKTRPRDDLEANKTVEKSKQKQVFLWKYQNSQLLKILQNQLI